MAANLLFDFFVDVSMGGEFENEIYFLLVIKVSMHFQDVWMIQICLDFNFLLQLFFHATLNEILFIDLFDGKQHVRRFVSYKITMKQTILFFLNTC